MYDHFDHRSGLKASLIADDVYDIIMKVHYTVCLDVVISYQLKLIFVHLLVLSNVKFEFVNVLFMMVLKYSL